MSDVDAARRAAVKHGAKRLFEPKTFPACGRQAVFTDPAGAVFAVLASSSGDPTDFLASSGEWIWSSLLENDPNASAGFFQALLGHDFYASKPRTRPIS